MSSMFVEFLACEKIITEKLLRSKKKSKKEEDEDKKSVFVF